MYSSSNYVHYAPFQPHTHVQSGPVMHSISQPMTSHQTYPQRDTPHTGQSSDSMSLLTTPHAQSTEQPSSPHSNDQWHTVNRKRHRNVEDHESPNAKKTDYWLGGTIPTNNRFSALTEETLEDASTHSTDPKPPPIFLSGVTNIKPLIELLNALEPNKCLVKTLFHDQVLVQPKESSVYSTIIKAVMEKNTEFHTYKPRQDRSFRVVLRNLHPSTEANDIKKALKEEGHEVTNIWNVKERTTNKPLPIHFINIKPHTNNNKIYHINTLLNTVVKFEAPHTKRDIPQCMSCQKYGHTKNLLQEYTTMREMCSTTSH